MLPLCVSLPNFTCCPTVQVPRARNERCHVDQASGKSINGQVGYASAISLVLFLLTLIPLLIVGISNNGDMLRDALAARRTRKAHKAALQLAKQTAAAPAVNAVKEGISA